MSRQTISQIERGDYSPSVTLALKIAKVFDARVEDIFGMRRKMKMNERKGEIRRENRKALKKFTLVIVAAGIVGGFAGFLEPH